MLYLVTDEGLFCLQKRNIWRFSLELDRSWVMEHFGSLLINFIRPSSSVPRLAVECSYRWHSVCFQARKKRAISRCSVCCTKLWICWVWSSAHNSSWATLNLESETPSSQEVLIDESYPLLPPCLLSSLPISVPPSLQEQLEERIKTLDIQLIKINTESELEIIEMKEKMDEVKVTITMATKGMRESLDKAETNIANLIKEVSMLATASPQERLFPLVQMIQKRPNIAGKITGMILVMDNSSNKSRPLWMSWPNTNNL